MTTKRQSAITRAVRDLIPQAPYFDAEFIRAKAREKHLRSLKPEVAAWLTIIAYIRHNFTDYDALRDDGYERDAAYFFVVDDINTKLLEWRASRLLDTTNPVIV